MANALLGTDKGQNLCFGVKDNSETPLIPFSYSLAQLRQASCLRIAMIGRVFGCLAKPVNYVGRRRDIRVAYGKADYLLAFSPFLGNFLINLNKKVWS